MITNQPYFKHLRPVKRTPIPHILSVLVLLGAIAGMVVLFGWIHAQVIGARYELEGVQGELAKLQDVVDEYNQLLEDKQRLASKIKAIEEIASDRIIWSRQLYNLNRLAPDNLWYTDITVATKKVPKEEPVIGQDGKVVMDPATNRQRTRNVNVYRFSKFRVTSPKPLTDCATRAPLPTPPKTTRSSLRFSRSSRHCLKIPCTRIIAFVSSPSSSSSGREAKHHDQFPERHRDPERLDVRGGCPGIDPVALCGLLFPRVQPNSSRWSHEKRHNKTREDLKKAQQLAKDIDELRAKTSETERLVQEFSDQLPSEREIATLVTQFEDIAQEVGGVDVEMRAQTAVQEGPKLTIPYRIVVHGNFHDIADFINRLERFKRYLKVSDLDIDRQEEGVSKAEFTLSTYTFVESGTGDAA